MFESLCLQSGSVAMANTIPEKLEKLISMEILSFMSHDRAESGLQSPHQGRGLIAVRRSEGRSHRAPDQWVSAETLHHELIHPLSLQT